MTSPGNAQPPLNSVDGSIVLVGHPNVGKSVLFQKLTGQFVTVSNYPGTTLEITRGMARSLPDTQFIDTPGVIAFPPHTEDELVTEELLFNEPLKSIIQVGDAKNLRRTLLLTVQLAEMGVPMVLALNMLDEAQDRGVVTNYKKLESLLQVPIVPTTAIRGQGVETLLESLQDLPVPNLMIDYKSDIESTLEQICEILGNASIEDESTGYSISCRAPALLWLSGDGVTESWLAKRLDHDSIETLNELRHNLQIRYYEPIAEIIQRTRLDYVNQIADSTVEKFGSIGNALSVRLGHLATQPLWGSIILLLVLYALYWFVGVFGAGILVNLLEARLFGEVINPWVVETVQNLIPFPLIVDLLVGDYGLWTVGITYALALILPIVTTFFLAFGILEDSGYLPRLAVLSNRFFQTLGLNGKAVLPMVLGLGCVTMATLTTRILNSKRERILVTLLLALAIPCSGQLGVVMGLLGGISLTATAIWGGVVLLVLIFVGWLAARLIPGSRTPLFVELPPLRWPQFSFVGTKTLARLEWYMKEVIPLFLLGTAILFVMDQIGLLTSLVSAMEPLVTGWLGLPPETGEAFLMGFFRRDFGATGMFVMESQGLLTPLQVVVAMVTVTLFIPCVASVLVIGKERGWQTAVGAVILIFPLAFLVGGLLFRLLTVIGWGV
ncbi:MAG: ferrous iron transport protein B [Chloroflexota bacterium]|nr:ferrous iron transport protein B [Chloroflexota bacterium]